MIHYNIAPLTRPTRKAKSLPSLKHLAAFTVGSELKRRLLGLLINSETKSLKDFFIKRKHFEILEMMLQQFLFALQTGNVLSLFSCKSFVPPLVLS